MSEIKNVVFDIGNVLINYTPDKVIDSFTELDDAGRKTLIKHVFESDMWLDLDRGTIALKAAEDILSDELPEYEPYIRRIFTEECLNLMFSEKPGTVEFMRELRLEGYNIYLLSNFSKEGFEYVEDKFNYLREPDGRIISSHFGMIKPERGIYELLLDKYSLDPGETLFIDDLVKNCEAAEAVGIKAIRFVGHEELKAEFKKYRRV